MGSHLKDFYRSSSDETPRGHFHHVISLHERHEFDWNHVREKAPDFCKGWFELSQLEPKDRIEFCRDFWIAKLPYHPKLQDFLINFFNQLDEIGIYLIQQKYDDPLEGHLVYNLSNDRGFFKGCCPITDQELMELRQSFPDVIFPNDYIAFLQIHNGFCKSIDCTGITKSHAMKEQYMQFQKLLEQQDRLTTSEGSPVDPKSLIPFYESFGMPFYQCFWKEWYPENEMGNVYYSGPSKTISFTKNEKEGSFENMAFPTFTDWIIFYLEQIE